MNKRLYYVQEIILCTNILYIYILKYTMSSEIILYTRDYTIHKRLYYAQEIILFTKEIILCWTQRLYYVELRDYIMLNSEIILCTRDYIMYKRLYYTQEFISRKGGAN